MTGFDPIKELYTIIDTKWTNNKPRLVKSVDARSVDLNEGDVIIFPQSIQTKEFLGIGGKEYRRHTIALVTIRTRQSRERLMEMLGEFERILSNPLNWYPFHLLIITNITDLSHREAKIYSVTLDVVAQRYESIE